MAERTRESSDRHRELRSAWFGLVWFGFVSLRFDERPATMTCRCLWKRDGCRNAVFSFLLLKKRKKTRACVGFDQTLVSMDGCTPLPSQIAATPALVRVLCCARHHTTSTLNLSLASGSWLWKNNPTNRACSRYSRWWWIMITHLGSWPWYSDHDTLAMIGDSETTGRPAASLLESISSHGGSEESWVLHSCTELDAIRPEIVLSCHAVRWTSRVMLVWDDSTLRRASGWVGLAYFCKGSSRHLKAPERRWSIRRIDAYVCIGRLISEHWIKTRPARLLFSFPGGKRARSRTVVMITQPQSQTGQGNVRCLARSCTSDAWQAQTELFLLYIVISLSPENTAGVCRVTIQDLLDDRQEEGIWPAITTTTIVVVVHRSSRAGQAMATSRRASLWLSLVVLCAFGSRESLQFDEDKAAILNAPPNR